jgi:hypothetical protein
MLSFGSKDLEALLNRHEGLFAVRSLDGSEDHLSGQGPVAGDVKGLGETDVDHGVVVLQVRAEAESLDTHPHLASNQQLGKRGRTKRRLQTEVLEHGAGVLGPHRELFRIDGKFLREGLDVSGVFIEEDLY